MLRNALTAVWFRFWNWGLVEILRYILGQGFEAEIWSRFWSWMLVEMLTLDWSLILVKSSKLKFDQDFETLRLCVSYFSTCPQRETLSHFTVDAPYGFGSKQNNPKISPPKDRQCWRFHFRSPQTPKLDQKNNQHTLPKSFKKFQWNFQFQVMPPHYFNQMFLSTKQFLIWKPQQKYHQIWR